LTGGSCGQGLALGPNLSVVAPGSDESVSKAVEAVLVDAVAGH